MLRHRAHLLIQKAALRLVTLAEQRRQDLAAIADLRDAIATGRKDGPLDRYDEAYEVAAWKRYRDALNGISGENTRYLHDRLRETILPMLQEVRSVLDFGVLCGQTLSNIAADHPHISFAGIDRSPVTKGLNDRHFAAGNLAFFAGDIESHLRAHAYPDGLFVHLRTATFLYPAQLEAVYGLLRQAGFKAVLAMEPTGFSVQTRKFHDLSVGPNPAVILRGTMKIHPYPALLRAAGFGEQAMELLRYPHPDRAMRNARIVARLSDAP